MKQGKFEYNRPMHGKGFRAVLPLVLLVLILTLSVGGTLAYLIAQPDEVTNTFIPAVVKCTVNDDFSITNDSNVKAYIRAFVVVDWMYTDTDGKEHVYGTKPEYTISVSDGWTMDASTGIYYYNSAVDPNPTRIASPVSVTCTETAPEGYSLVIQVVAEAIQAGGMGANVDTAKEAWEHAVQQMS